MRPPWRSAVTPGSRTSTTSDCRSPTRSLRLAIAGSSAGRLTDAGKPTLCSFLTAATWSVSGASGWLPTRRRAAPSRALRGDDEHAAGYDPGDHGVFPKAVRGRYVSAQLLSPSGTTFPTPVRGVGGQVATVTVLVPGITRTRPTTPLRSGEDDGPSRAVVTRFSRRTRPSHGGAVRVDGVTPRRRTWPPGRR